MKFFLALVALASAIPFTAAGANAPALGIDRAKSHAAAAIASARSMSVFDVAVAVVDTSGALIYAERLDDAKTDALENAIKNARSTAKSRKPTPAAVVLMDGSQVIGALAIGGGVSTQNQQIVAAGAKALDTSRLEKVTFISQAQLEESYGRFGTVVGGVGYSVITSRRTAPGEAEMHLTDADIIYVIEGSATFVTGGEIQEFRNTSPIEIRGKELKGGDEHRLNKGDLITVPKGVPHWFKSVDGKFSYYVVKAKS